MMTAAAARTTGEKIPSTINIFWIIAISLIMLLSIAIVPIKSVLAAAADTDNDINNKDPAAANGDLGNGNSKMVLPVKGVSAGNTGNNNNNDGDDDDGKKDTPKTHS